MINLKEKANKENCKVIDLVSKKIIERQIEDFKEIKNHSEDLKKIDIDSKLCLRTS